MLLWFASRLSSHHGAHIPFMLAPKIKAGLSMFLYCKVSTLTSFALRLNNVGMLINLISNDLSALDERIIYLFFFCPFILITFGVIFIVVSKIGLIGIAAVSITLLIVPITHLVSKFNGRILR